MHRQAQLDIVRYHQVGDDLIQHRLLKTVRSQRSHEARLLEAIDDVVLGLRNPLARGLQRAHVL